LVSAAGPFSGTENAHLARLHVRLRFFLPTVLIAIPLATYWVHRLGRGTAFAAAACAIGIAGLTGLSWLSLFLYALVGSGLALLAFARIPSLSRAAVRGIALASLIAGPCAAAWAMTYKQPENDRVMRTVIRAWNVLDEVPKGARIAWFSTFEGYKYYRAFGRKLIYVPVPVGEDGSRTQFMHEYWRKYKPTWWEELPSPESPNGLMHNLRERHVTHVLIMRRHAGPWPGPRAILIKAKGVHAIKKQENVTLFAIDPISTQANH